MKATIEFNLPEDQEEHQLALDGWRWRSVVIEAFNRLRRWDKARHAPDTQEVRAMLVEAMEEYGVEI